jgi:hypothetical protein
VPELVELECVSVTCENGPNGDPGFWMGIEGDSCPLCGATSRVKPPSNPDQTKIKPGG